MAQQNSSNLYGVAELDLAPGSTLSFGAQKQRIRSITNMAGVPRYADGGDIGLPRSTYLDAAWDQFDWDTQRLFLLGIGASAAAAGLWLWLWLAAMPAPLPSSLVWLATALGCFGAGCASVSMLTMAMQFARQSGPCKACATAAKSSPRPP